MEAVGAAASLVTLIGTSICAVKTTYRLISTVKDGPKDAGMFLKLLENLIVTLNKVSSSRLATRPDNEIADLKAQISDTQQLVSSFCKRLEIMLGKSSNRSLDATWKKICYIIKGNESETMWSKLQRQVTLINLEMELLQGESTSRHLETIHATTLDLQQRDEQQSNQLAIYTDLVRKHETSISGVEVAVNETKNVSLALHGKTHQIVQSAVEDNQENLAETRKYISQGFQDVKGLMDGVSSISQTQYHTIMSQLAQLQDQLGQLSSQQSQGYDAEASFSSEQPTKLYDCSDPAPVSCSGNTGKEGDLSDCMERLGELVRTEASTCWSSDAQTVIDDLAHLISTLSKHQYLESHKLERYKDAEPTKETEIERYYDIERSTALLRSSMAVDINQSEGRNDSNRDRTQRYTHKRSYQEFQDQETTMTVVTRSSSLTRDSEGHHGTCDLGTARFYSTFRFKTKRMKREAIIAVIFDQLYQHEHNISLHPRIIVSPIVPDTSLVFSLVTDGDLAGLRKLIGEGKASIRDCNSRGTTLLHYACDSAQPDVCKFLIDSGLDVDCCSLDLRSNYITNPLLATGYPGDDFDESSLNPQFECRRLLLEAGADPSLRINIDDGMVSHMEVAEFTEFGLRLVIHLAADFIDLEEEDESGRTMLLHMCLAFDQGLIYRPLRFLLSRGVNMNARDRAGRSCLHIFLTHARNPREDKETLKLLIQNGADIRAEDNYGFTVSATAYTFPNSWARVGHYPQDLWDVVLTELGHDIRDFRRGYPRIAKYGRYYTRQDFENLWGEDKDACPYYCTCCDDHCWHVEGEVCDCHTTEDEYSDDEDDSNTYISESFAESEGSDIESEDISDGDDTNLEIEASEDYEEESRRDESQFTSSIQEAGADGAVESITTTTQGWNLFTDEAFWDETSGSFMPDFSPQSFADHGDIQLDDNPWVT